jgi:hypothetical protein
MKKRKEYVVMMKLSYDYDDSMIDEWEDNGDKELTYLDQDSVRWEMTSWLEDLGFTIEHIDVVEDRSA